MELALGILKTAEEIMNAAETVDDNEVRCRQLARRVSDLVVALREDMRITEAGDSVTLLVRRGPLKTLKDTLDYAHWLVESCRRRPSDPVAWAVALWNSQATSTKLQDVMTSINDCLLVLLYVERVARNTPAQGPPSLRRSIQKPVQAPSLRKLSDKWSAHAQPPQGEFVPPMISQPATTTAPPPPHANTETHSNRQFRQLPAPTRHANVGTYPVATRTEQWSTRAQQGSSKLYQNPHSTLRAPSSPHASTGTHSNRQSMQLPASTSHANTGTHSPMTRTEQWSTRAQQGSSKLYQNPHSTLRAPSPPHASTGTHSQNRQSRQMPASTSHANTGTHSPTTRTEQWSTRAQQGSSKLYQNPHSTLRAPSPPHAGTGTHSNRQSRQLLASTSHANTGTHSNNNSARSTPSEQLQRRSAQSSTLLQGSSRYPLLPSSESKRRSSRSGQPPSAQNQGSQSVSR